MGHGLGSAKYAQLQAVLEMAKRHFKEILERGSALTSPEITRAYLSAQLRGYSYEVFACLFLDNQHRVIKLEELFREQSMVPVFIPGSRQTGAVS